jgi:hypothetical protein
MNRQKIFDLIQAKFDNLDMLDFINDLLNTIVLDVELMNDFENDYMNDFDLGNNTYIKNEDLESIVSIIETIKDIKKYNER